MNRYKTLIIAVAVILLGVGIAVVIYTTRPKAERKKPPRMTPVVLTQSLKSEDRHVDVKVMGKVVPAMAIDIKARVSGEIIYAAPEWIDGGMLKKGQTVVRLENSDYRIALDQAESELALEMGRQDVAGREWEMLKIDSPSAMDKELALRKPQLKSAKARVELAQLNLDRTEIKSPFNAIVTDRRMNLGDQATPQMTLGRIVSTDSYHVRVSVPVDKLKWIDLPSGKSPGSEATLYLEGGATRKGRVIKLLGDLEEKGRMARCLVEIKDPWMGDSPLLLNSFAKVSIKGKRVDNVYAIDRNSFRDGSSIWLLTNENRLKLLQIDPMWGDREQVFFQAEIPEGHNLITSSLGMAIDGMDLRLAEAKGEKKPKGKPDRPK